jgi:hypothetical protein
LAHWAARALAQAEAPVAALAQEPLLQPQAWPLEPVPLLPVLLEVRMMPELLPRRSLHR